MQIGPLLLAAVGSQLARGQKTSRLSFTHSDCGDVLVAGFLAVRRSDLVIGKDWLQARGDWRFACTVFSPKALEPSRSKGERTGVVGGG